MTILVRFLATDLYLNKKQTFIVQLLYVTRGKLKNGPCTTRPPSNRSIKKLVEIDVTMNLIVTYY